MARSVFRYPTVRICNSKNPIHILNIQYQIHNNIQWMTVIVSYCQDPQDQCLCPDMKENRSPKLLASFTILFLVFSSISLPPKLISQSRSQIPSNLPSLSFEEADNVDLWRSRRVSLQVLHCRWIKGIVSMDWHSKAQILLWIEENNYIIYLSK